MFGGHGRLEVGHGGVSAFVIVRFPFGEHTDGEATKHAEHPHGVAMADATIVLSGGRIEALMQTTFDAPIGAIRRQPLRSV